MPVPTAESPVRPLDEAPPQQPDPTPPRLLLGAVLLAIGGLLGWTAATLGGGSAVTTTAPAAPVSAAEAVPADGPGPGVAWTRATSVPPAPAGLDYAGTSEMVEIDGTIHLIVNFQNTTTGELTSELWQSSDGLEWSTQPLVADEPRAAWDYRRVVGFDLAASGSTMLMTGRDQEGLALFRSIPGRVIGGSSWFRVELDAPQQFRPEFLSPIVNGQGDTLIMAAGHLDIWRDVIAAHVPEDVDLNDARYVLREDGVLFDTSTENGVDFAEVVPVLGEPPELIVTGDNIWIRLVTVNGEEVLQSVPLPEGTYPITQDPTLNRIPVLRAWTSVDDEFLPVTSREALSWGYLLPQPWGDGFIAANYELDESFSNSERATLLVSSTGRAWQQDEEQPPAECGPFDMAISRNRMHLTADDGTQCMRDIGSDWVLLPERSEVSYTIGGPAGFIGYPDSFEYDTAQFSPDGISWIEIEVPGLAPYPTLSILRDRLVSMSVDRPRPDRPAQIAIWVGETDP